MMKDQFANYVVQKMLDVADAANRKKDHVGNKTTYSDAPKFFIRKAHNCQVGKILPEAEWGTESIFYSVWELQSRSSYVLVVDVQKYSISIGLLRIIFLYQICTFISIIVNPL
jgi:hypothetical protein